MGLRNQFANVVEWEEWREDMIFWKWTNKEIKKRSFYDKNRKDVQHMKYPLNNIMDCNYWHYTLQLSTYA